MKNESLEIIKTSSEELKLKRKQLNALQIKESESHEKLAKLNKEMEQAIVDSETCARANLAGNSTDQDVRESKDKIKKITDEIQQIKDSLKYIAEVRPALNHEYTFLKEDIENHRAILCAKLAKEAHEDMASNRKLNEKLVAGYAPFRVSGDFDTSWTRYLLLNFPCPSPQDLTAADNKLKASNEFMRD